MATRGNRPRGQDDQDSPDLNPPGVGFELYRYKNADETATRNWHGYYSVRRTEAGDYEIRTVPSSLGNPRRLAASSPGRASRSTTIRWTPRGRREPSPEGSCLSRSHGPPTSSVRLQKGSRPRHHPRDWHRGVGHSIKGNVEALNLAPIAARQAETKRREAEAAVASQIGETWTWCLVLQQPDPMGEAEWDEIRVAGQDPLAIRANKRLVAEELLLPVLGPVRLRMELDRTLWRDKPHIGIKQLWEYLCSYLYLPRLKDRDVLLRAIQEGTSTVVASDTFAYAEDYDEEANRYVGLRLGGGGSVVMDSSSLLVKPEVAREHVGRQPIPPPQPPGPRPPGLGPIPPPKREALPRRFHASVTLDPNRVG